MSDSEDSGAGKPSGRDKPNPLAPRRFKSDGPGAGRKKGCKNRKTIVLMVARERHTVTDGGKRRKRPTSELILLLLRNLAMEGKDQRAFDELNRLIRKYEPRRGIEPQGLLVVPAEMTEEEWIRMAEEANKTARPPDNLDQLIDPD